MAKATITVTSRVYAIGTREVELPNLTTDDNGIRIDFTRESWPVGADVITGVVEGSNDNDATRFPLAPFRFDGGDQVNPRTGLPVLSCGQLWTWPESYDSQGNAIPHRPGRVFVTVTNSVSLRTAITLTGV
jgi:hypothetical protein